MRRSIATYADKRAGGDLFKHLRRQGKKYDKRRNEKSPRGQSKGRVSTDDRPEVVDEKARVGDWEIDTMIGKGHSGTLVTVVERSTNFTVAAPVNSKCAAEVTQATIELLAPLRLLVYTITADNGKAFAYHDQVAKALNAAIHFAHPYSSWARGLNENTNGLLRQYFPKGTNVKPVSQQEVDRAVVQLNPRPRQGLAFKTPKQRMDAPLMAVAA